MSPDSSQKTLAEGAARAYYVAGETMESIAARLRVSRSTVSRLLRYARENGIVEITVHAPQTDAGTQLSRALAARWRITARVIAVHADASDSERLDSVTTAAAQTISELVSSHMTIGVAWGSTLAATSRHLPPKSTVGTRFVQLNGSGNIRTTGLGFASDILRRFGHAYAAQVQQFPVPAFFDDPETKNALWRERSTRRILDLHAALDLVIFSVGAKESPVPSHVYADDYLDPGDLDELARENVVGDVATVFYRLDGSSADIALNARASGPSLAALAAVPRRVCIAAGESKATSLAGALAAGLVSDLILDDATARRLLELA